MGTVNATAWSNVAWSLNDVLAVWGFSEATPFSLSLPCALGILVVTTCIPYFMVGAVCHWMDTADEGKRFRKHKIQQNAPPLTPEQRREAWAVAAFNMIVLNSVVGSVIAYPMWLAREPPATPNWLEFPVHLAAYVVLTDLWFYATHRCMHTKAFYSRFHKLHHRFKAPEAICGAQQHLVEAAASGIVAPRGQHLRRSTQVLLARVAVY